MAIAPPEVRPVTSRRSTPTRSRAGPARSAASCSRGSAAGPSPLDRGWWDDRLMALTLGDPEVKVQLFRFIDALPALTTPEAVRRHLAEYLDEAGDRVPWWLRLARRPWPPRGRSAARSWRRPGPVGGDPHGPPVHRRRRRPTEALADRPRPPPPAAGLHRRPAGRGGHQRGRGRRLPADLPRPAPRPGRPAGRRARDPPDRPRRPRPDPPRQPLAQADEPDAPVRRPPRRDDHRAASSTGSGRSSGRPARSGRTSTSTWSSTPTRT